MATVYILLLYTVIHQASASLLNVAQGKTASASSMIPGFSASTAVDGNTAATYGVSTVIDTGYGPPSAWWKVDLEREVQDAIVRIYFRTDYTWRRNGVKLYTSTSSFPESNPTSQGELCDTVTGDPNGSDIPDVYNVPCPGRWRYLLLYTDTDNDGQGPVLDFGEVEVLACSDGLYGDACTKPCNSRHCLTMPTTCDKDGTCSNGCQNGWTGLDCTACSVGLYGDACTKPCNSRHCLNMQTTCDKDGTCSNGCQNGWTGLDCTACSVGLYGDACTKPCNSRHCLNMQTTCDKDGRCPNGCQNGWAGLDCTECDHGINYGVNCAKSCSARHCNQPSSECNTETGQCIGGCQDGWTGEDCTSQCPAGTFGSDCTSCSTRHCQGESDCPADGTCFQGCLEGWSGRTCLQECLRGMYGPGCSMTCGNCSSDYACHHVTGNCPSGCKAGWRTEKCNEVCRDGTYGSNCREKCGQCDGVCNSVDGRCPAGCLNGYNGTKCDVAPAELNINGKEPLCFGVASLVGAVVGSILLVVLLCVGIFICLIRQGRLQLIKMPEEKQGALESCDDTQMSSIVPRPNNVSERAQSINNVTNNDYSELDPSTIRGNKDYDVIQPKHYQNL